MFWLATKHPQFDPVEIPPFSVIRCSYQFRGDVRSSPKRFVCLAHVEGAAICIKATSQIEAYKNNPKRRAGIVLYPAGSLPFFEKDTIIEPDNRVAILHSTLAKQHVVKELTILGIMPDGFVDRLIEAVIGSETMSPKEQRAFINLLMA